MFGSWSNFLTLSLCTFSRASEPIATYAPVPADAVGPPLNSDGWRVESFGAGAYMVTDNQYNALFFVSNKGVIVVDAPPTIGKNMLYAIGNTTKAPITHLVYSHAHADHIGAAYLFNKNVKRVAHQMTKDILEATLDEKRPAPHTVFDRKHIISVGNQTILLEYKGLNHQPGNIFIYAPKQKVLMLVDIIFPGWVPFAHLGAAQFVPGFVKAHDQVLEYEFDHFVGGHLTRSGKRVDVELARDYIHDLMTNCAQAISLTGEPPNNVTNPISAQELLPAVMAANPNNTWAGFKAVMDITSSYCNNVTNKKWLGKLAGADVYGFENAYSIVDSLRIDYDILGPFGVQNA